MSVVRAAICDDEQSWLDEAQQILTSYAREEGLDLPLASYGTSHDLLAATEPSPDVLFCDIELGDSDNGIELVRKVASRWPSCQIVYVTNFLRYAPEVYVTEHLWFVLKERFAERLPEIMEKLQRKMEDDSRSLMVKAVTHETLLLPCPKLVSLERRGRTTFIREVGGRVFEVPDRLPALLERLPSRSFARCHASFAVNLSHVRLVRQDTIEMDDGSLIPISRRFAHGFRDGYLDWADDHAV